MLLIRSYITKNFILVIFLGLAFTTEAQVSYENRLELDLVNGFSNERLTTFSNHGFILSSRNVENSGKKSEWKFELFNTNLESVMINSVLLDKKFIIDERWRNGSRSHRLFKDEKGKFSLVTIESSNLEITKVDFELDKKTFVKFMVVHGEYAFLKTVVKKTDVLMVINLNSGEKKIVPITIDNIDPQKLKIWKFQYFNDDDNVLVYVSAQLDSGRRDMFVFRVSGQEGINGNFNLTEDIHENIMTISATKVKEDTYVYTGRYSIPFVSKYSGIYLCQVTNDEIDFMELHNFLEMENFLSFLPEKEKERVQKKKNRKEIKGEALLVDYRITLHKLINTDDGYLLLGEAYYPTYQLESRTSYGGGARSAPKIVFDGYQYTHAIVCKFNKKGELLRNDMFEMWSSYKQKSIKKFISVSKQSQDTIKLVYQIDDVITSKSLNMDGSINLETHSEKIKSNYEGDETTDFSSNLIYWYDNYYISYGKKWITNKENIDNVDRKRKVYYVSKLKNK